MFLIGHFILSLYFQLFRFQLSLVLKHLVSFPENSKLQSTADDFGAQKETQQENNLLKKRLKDLAEVD